MRTDYNSLEAAVHRYPNLAQTVKLAKEVDFKLLGHAVQFNKRGTVNSHWFKIEVDGDLTYERNQRLLGMLKHMKRFKK